MPQRYRFNTVFTIQPGSGFIVTNLRIQVNGVTFESGTTIHPGLTFGGINIYNYIGQDVAGEWNTQSRTLVFRGFYT